MRGRRRSGSALCVWSRGLRRKSAGRTGNLRSARCRQSSGCQQGRPPEENCGSHDVAERSATGAPEKLCPPLSIRLTMVPIRSHFLLLRGKLMRRVPGMGFGRWAIPILPLVVAVPAFGVSCITQSQMNAQERDALRQAATGIAGNVEAANAEAVKAQTIGSVAAQFEGIAGSIQSVSPR